jgi:hypothetical protein
VVALFLELVLEVEALGWQEVVVHGGGRDEQGPVPIGVRMYSRVNSYRPENSPKWRT